MNMAGTAVRNLGKRQDGKVHKSKTAFFLLRRIRFPLYLFICRSYNLKYRIHHKEEVL